ncbi:helix-turn-helix domain-containing protein [Novosphingobium sp.]|uniref:IclR family transcriptional regulator n=1 Tax=Novosphingobium sp. TaxID=1874826 RepID=UPI0031CE0988
MANDSELTRRDRPGVSGVAAVDRALSVLRAFERGDAVLTLSELARRTDLVKSTVMRLAVSLEEAGFLLRLADGQYQLGGEIARLSSIYQDAFGFERQILPILQRLSEQSGETASFYVRHGAYRMCLYRINSPHRLRIHLQPGDTRPMDNSAIAQALRLTDPQAVRVLYSAGSQDPYASSMAIAVFLGDGPPVGALTLSGPSNRLHEGRLEELAPLLSEALSNLLSGMNADVHRDVILQEANRTRS